MHTIGKTGYEKSTLADALIRKYLISVFEVVCPKWVFPVKDFFFLCSQFMGIVRK